MLDQYHNDFVYDLIGELTAALDKRQWELVEQIIAHLKIEVRT